MHFCSCIVGARKLVFLLCLLASSCALGDASRYPGAYGDPHFTGWDGVNFDFTGQEGGVYCMISDERFHMNMKLGGRTMTGLRGKDVDGQQTIQEAVVGKHTRHEAEVGVHAVQDGTVNDRGTQERSGPAKQEEAAGGRIKRKQTWIKEIGIMYRGHRLEIAAKEGGDMGHKGSFMKRLEINGEEKLQLLEREGDVFVSEDKQVGIAYEKRESHGVMPFDLYKVLLGCPASSQFLEEVVMTVKVGPEVPEERDPHGHDACFHLSVEMVGGRSDFWTGAIHGLLGQSLLNARDRSRLRGLGSFKTTWNPLLVQLQVEGLNGDGYLDGNVSDYVSSGLLNSDCRFSRFNPNLLSGPLPTTVSLGYSRRYLPGFSPYKQYLTI